jgi:hypothetical protein
MKFRLYFFLVFLLFFGCQNEHKLTFEPYAFENEACDNCPMVSFDIPKALGITKTSKAINTALEEELIFLLSFDEETDVTSVDDAMQSFKNGYVALQQLYTNESTAWEAKIDGKVTYENAEFITIELDAYLFTGGAHGYISKQLLNFDKNKGVQLENWELFKDAEDFRAFAEEKFRQSEQIPNDKSINYTGFMFEEDAFYLPENIGFTKDGLKLLYNPYEVASYADGPIELILTHKEVKKHLSKKTKS